MRVIFLGTPAFAVPSLRAIAAARHEILLVVTQPPRPRGRGLALSDSEVATAAHALHLEVLAPARARDGLGGQLRLREPTALVVVAYGKMLPPDVLGAAPLGAVNLHPSLLPRHRGASPIATAILAGDAETGVSTMRLDDTLDGGPIYLQESTPIAPGEDAEELAARLAMLGAELLVRTLDALDRGDLAARAQDESLATYAAKLESEDAWIDWSLEAAVIERRVRGLKPWPLAQTRSLDGRRLQVLRAAAIAGGEAPAGSVVSVSPDLVVACGRGALRVLEARPEGRRAMAAKDLVNGRVVRLGDVLGSR